MLKLLDGKKNYLFGALLLVVGLMQAFCPALLDEMVKTLNANPEGLKTAAAGVALVLGRNALSKVGK